MISKSARPLLLMLERMKLLAEGAGATALAGAIKIADELKGKTVVVARERRQYRYQPARPHHRARPREDGAAVPLRDRHARSSRRTGKSAQRDRG